MVKDGKGRVPRRGVEAAEARLLQYQQDSFLNGFLVFLCMYFLGIGKTFFILIKKNFFGQSRTFLCWRRTFLVGGGLFSIGGGLFSIGVGLFLSPTVTEKSPPPTGKSPTAIPKRCWTLEYSVELEFSSPFMEQWTLDGGGVQIFNF